MNEAALIRYITDTFDGLDCPVASGDTFFIYDPQHNLPPERQFPFATLVTGDNNDKVSHLSRPDVFRLNIGVSKETYLSMFGPPPSRAEAGETDAYGVIQTGYDYSALDQFMPHPVYCRMYWVCVLNPSEATFERVKELLAEAYELVAEKYGKARPQ